jgi:hypothetical protein
MMNYWHSILPDSFILDMPYELVVDNVEERARKMIEFVGLEWNDNCLSFYENTRDVKTASVAQVRKPIYKSSVARWENFKDYLQPLYEIVKDYRPVSSSK